MSVLASKDAPPQEAGVEQPRKKRRTGAAARQPIPVDEQALTLMTDRMMDGVDDSWFPVLKGQFETEAGQQVVMRLAQELGKSKTIYPPPEAILNAFKLTPMNKVKIVILGQDPYHNVGQAMGLAFSVPDGVAKMPPSLPRILREAGVPKDLCSTTGDLTTWAKQGVLLLNPVLTVEKGQPGSHRKWGWQSITMEALARLSNDIKDRRLIFLLWGGKAAEAETLIDTARHLVLKASHPSPLATRGDFVGCAHFQKANECLIEQGLRPIQWDSLTQPDWVMGEPEEDLPAASANPNSSENDADPALVLVTTAEDSGSEEEAAASKQDVLMSDSASASFLSFE